MKIAFGAEGFNKNASSMNMSLDDVIKQNQLKASKNQNSNVNNRFPKQQFQQKQQQWNQQKPKQQQQQWNQQKPKPQQQQQQQKWTQQRPNQQQQRWPQQKQQQLTTKKTAIMQRTGPMQSGPAKLLISNLDSKVNEADMNTLFKEFGEISQASIHYDCNGASIGSAHICFKRYVDALKGLQKYNGITLDGRPMVIRIESMPFAPTNQATGQQKVFTITPAQGINQQPMGKKALKRLQKGQPLMGNAPPLISKPPVMQQQSNTVRMPPSIQAPYGVSKNYSFGVTPNMGMNLNAQGGAGLLGSAPQQGILNRVGSFNTGMDRNYQPTPSILQRLDGGLMAQNQPAMGGVLSRLGGTVNANAMGNAARNVSILNRVGPKQGNSQFAQQQNKPKQQTPLIPGFPGGMMGRQWSFAIPGGMPVNAMAGNQQRGKANIQGKKQQGIQQRIQQNKQGQKNKQVQQQQQQQQPKKKLQNKNSKSTPTAAELDAELDAYLSEMTKK